ncbi:MAG TPA: hypothetical protein VGM43_01695 [Bryobacteraceae bacterium]|jgi:hypothetical protein
MQHRIPILVFPALILAQVAHAATPQLVSLTPASGSGQTQTFTLTASDSAGAADIRSVNLMINSAFSGSNACWMAFDRTSGLKLEGDDGVWNPGGNSQCVARLLSVNDSENDTSVSISVSFDRNWTGDRTLWAAATDAAGNSTGYQQIGTYTITAPGPAPDFTVSITPPALPLQPGSGERRLKITATGINGFFGGINFRASVDPLPAGMFYHETYPNGVFGYSLYVPPTGSGEAGIDLVPPQSGPPVDNVVMTVTFTSTVGNIQHTVQVPIPIVNPAAPALTLNPESGSGSTRTFTITATDKGGGFQSVGGINFLLNSSLNGANGCWLYYQPAQSSGNPPVGTLSLASDDTTNWSQTTAISSSSSSVDPIHNSQCSVFGGPTTVQGDGDTLTLTITLTFTSAFAGPKQAFVRASDVIGNDSTYQQLGTFTAAGASAGPDFSVSVSPGSQNAGAGTPATYSVKVTGANGYAGNVSLSVTGLPPDATLTPPASAGPGQSANFEVSPASTTPPGSYTLTITGTDGGATHTTTAILHVLAADLSYLSAVPVQGSGASETFSFLTSNQGGSLTPAFLDVLINSSLNGQGGCWMYFDGATLELASDDGTAWQSFGANPTIQNSQCTLSAPRIVQVPNGLRFDVPITFSVSFAGNKNVYMYTADQQGHGSGYQYEGAWNVP